ncbi:hypothetical protein NQ314_014122 [Rhamnusium bicolor]|uniref:Uncharacterized protein n=1 Tax=Rhamnusium bicolor TaxID=1586634 RepID=A0AAV8X2P4_9CUCU|nr:hypothetical protein NQ314_014122 [Rhamnusium bicolor]
MTNEYLAKNPGVTLEPDSYSRASKLFKTTVAAAAVASAVATSAATKTRDATASTSAAGIEHQQDPVAIPTTSKATEPKNRPSN